MTDPSIKSLIDLDKKYSRTPDKASLRYNGSPIPVFLWDDLADTDTLRAVVGLDKSTVYKHMNVSFSEAYTKEVYLPWYNMKNDPGTYPAYCLEDIEDTEWMSLDDYMFDPAQPIKGKIVNVSLKTLEELDLYYLNETYFQRMTIEVYTSQYNTTPVLCYTWLNDLEDICDYQGPQAMFKLKEGLDFCPFSSVTVKGQDMYSMAGV